VSIACELVTSPSILFLDEPTSGLSVRESKSVVAPDFFLQGLDSCNAYNVVESLISLARDYNRTVVFTIHQPRSNIVALFDQLIVLAQGKLVYSGEYSKCQDYFSGIGQLCPPGFNIADFLSTLESSPFMSCRIDSVCDLPVDLTVQAGKEDRVGDGNSLECITAVDSSNPGDAESGFGGSHLQGVPLVTRGSGQSSPNERVLHPRSGSPTRSYLQKKT
jgi:hypothetical protein